VGTDVIQMVQNMVQWQYFVNTEMDFGVHTRAQYLHSAQMKDQLTQECVSPLMMFKIKVQQYLTVVEAGVTETHNSMCYVSGCAGLQSVSGTFCMKHVSGKSFQ